METSDHFKNGATPKSQKSRKTKTTKMKNRKYSIATFLFMLLISPFYVYSQYSVPYVETYEKCNYCGETRQHIPHVYDDNGMTKSVNECAFYYLKNSQKGSVVFESLFGTPVSNQCGKSSTGDHYWVKKSEKKYFQLTTDKIKSYKEALVRESEKEDVENLQSCEGEYYTGLAKYLGVQSDKINSFLYYYLTGSTKMMANDFFTTYGWPEVDNIIVDKQNQGYKLKESKEDILKKLYELCKDNGFKIKIQYNSESCKEYIVSNKLVLEKDLTLGMDYQYIRTIKDTDFKENRFYTKMCYYNYIGDNQVFIKFYTLKVNIQLLYAIQLYKEGDKIGSYEILSSLFVNTDKLKENTSVIRTEDLDVEWSWLDKCDVFSYKSSHRDISDDDIFLIYYNIKARAYDTFMSLCSDSKIKRNFLDKVCTAYLGNNEKMRLIVNSIYDDDVYKSTLKTFAWENIINKSITKLPKLDYPGSYPSDYSKVYIKENFGKVRGGVSRDFIYNLACLTSLKGDPARAIDYLKYWMYLTYNESKKENVDNELLNLTKAEDLKNLVNFKEFKQILEWVNGFKNLDSDKKFQTNIVKIYQD